VVLAFFVIVTAWMEPAARWIAWAAVSSKGFLPRGELWPSSTTLFTSWTPFIDGLSDSGWRDLGLWFDSTPWPAIVVLGIATVRLVIWTGVKRLSTRVDEGKATHNLRFGGCAESVSLIAWTALGAGAWRFWWGLMWDCPQGAVVVWFPTMDGAAHIGLLWLGAALGYAWTIALLIQHRTIRPPGLRRCINCGYSLQDLDLRETCPECGQDQRAPRKTNLLSRTINVFRRYWPLAIAGMFLASPYVSTLLAAVLAHV